MPNLGSLIRHRRAVTITGVTVIAAALAMAAVLSGPRAAHAQSASSGVRVAIISPANGGGAAGQTLEAGAFAIVNDTPFTQSVSSVTIAFSDPSIFSSAGLSESGVKSAFPSSVHYDNQFTPGTPSHVSASSTFYFGPALQIPPGGEPVFALTVKMATSISRNETGSVAYAGMISTTTTGTSAPLWMALAIVGLAMAGLPAGKRRRATIIAALVILLTLGAPGCGGDNSSASSTQSVTAVSAVPNVSHAFATSEPDLVSGLPLRLGVVSWH